MQNELVTTFSMLAPEDEEESVFYCLCLETQQKLPTKFSLQLDLLRRENSHYALCRQKGQFGESKAFLLSASANQEYLLAKNNCDKKLGDIGRFFEF